MVRHGGNDSLDQRESVDAAGGRMDVDHDHEPLWRRPRSWGALVPGIVAGLLGAYVLSLPHALSGIHGSAEKGNYDDGIYFGAAIRLIHGWLPYRDFLLPHPPGLTVLLSPIAAL